MASFLKDQSSPRIGLKSISTYLIEAIRDIWAIRYAKYRKSNKLTNQAVRERRRTTAEISEKAHRLRYGRINEDTWRGLEAEVMRMFERKAVW